MKKYALSAMLLASHLCTGLAGATETLQESCVPIITDEKTVIFKIINEVSFQVPVTFSLDQIETDKRFSGTEFKKTLYQKPFEVRGKKDLLVTKSDYSLGVWYMNSLKIQGQPENITFKARIGFNTPYYNPYISREISVEYIFDLERLMPGKTFRIVPNERSENSFLVLEEGYVS